MDDLQTDQNKETKAGIPTNTSDSPKLKTLRTFEGDMKELGFQPEKGTAATKRGKNGLVADLSGNIPRKTLKATKKFIGTSPQTVPQKNQAASFQSATPKTSRESIEYSQIVKSRLEASRQEKDRLQEQARVLGEKRQSLADELLRLDSNLNDSLNRELKTRGEEIDLIEEERNKFEEKKRALLSEIDTVGKQVDDIYLELKTKKEEATKIEQERKALTEQISVIGSEKETIEKDFEKIRREKEELERKSNEIQRDIEILKRSEKHIESEKERVTANLREMDKYIEEEKKAREEEMAKLQRGEGEIRQKRQEHEETLRRFKAEKEEKEKEIERQRERQKNALDQLERTQKSIENRQREQERLLAHLENVAGDLEQARALLEKVAGRREEKDTFFEKKKDLETKTEEREIPETKEIETTETKKEADEFLDHSHSFQETYKKIDASYSSGQNPRGENEMNQEKKKDELSSRPSEPTNTEKDVKTQNSTSPLRTKISALEKARLEIEKERARRKKEMGLEEEKWDTKNNTEKGKQFIEKSESDPSDYAGNDPYREKIENARNPFVNHQ